MKSNNSFLGNKLTAADKEYEKKRAEQFENDKKLYPEYCALTQYQRNCLPATNYHRVLQGQKEIPVPPSDSNYAKYFDKNCYELAKTYNGSYFPISPVIEEKPIAAVETKKTKKEPVKVESQEPHVVEKKQEVKTTKPEPKPEAKIEVKKPEVQVKKETVTKKEVVLKKELPTPKTIVKKVSEKPVNKEVKKETPAKKSASKKVAPKKNSKNQVDLF
jgi:hypothetical protein